MSSSRILVVDDEPDIRNLVHEILEDEGYRVHVAEDGATARRVRRDTRPDLILLDIWMPDVDGVSLLKEWTEEGGPHCPVVMMSGHGTVETAVEATRLGAYDFIEKPLSLTRLLLTVERALAASGLPTRDALSARVASLDTIEPVGRSIIMRELREQARRVAGHDSPVLISGEAGAGRRCLARYLHSHSARRNGPLVEIGLGGLDGDQAGAELLGFESDSGVVRGCLEQASGGTLVVTELTDLGPEQQAALLAGLQRGHFYRVGGDTPVPLNARIIAGTGRDLRHEVQVGRFSEDLYYHLNVVPIAVPPLRDHCEDVPELLAFWVERLVERERLPYRRFALAAQNRLRNHVWPGNVRELKNLVQRLLIMGQGEEITLEETEAALIAMPVIGDVEADPAAALPLDLPLRDAREQFERLYLQHQLKRAQGSVGQLAKLTGMERTHLYRKLKALGIDPKVAG